MTKSVSLLVVLCSVLASRPAAALLICKNPKGALFLRDSCKKKETQLSAADIGAKGDRGDDGAPGPGIRVVDAAGNAVGFLGGTSAVNSTVLRQIQNDWFSFQIDSSGFLQANAQMFFYDGPNCTGTPYYPPPPDFPVLPVDASANFLNVIGSKGYFRKVDDATQTLSAYRISTTTGSTANDAMSTCTSAPGVVMGTAHACNNLSEFCVNCCRLWGPTLVSQFHEVDLASFALTPPFHFAPQ